MEVCADYNGAASHIHGRWPKSLAGLAGEILAFARTSPFGQRAARTAQLSAAARSARDIGQLRLCEIPSPPTAVGGRGTVAYAPPVMCNPPPPAYGTKDK